MKNNNLDQFYTNPLVADELVETIHQLLHSAKNMKFVEPSAGTGNFIDALIKSGVKRSSIKAFDLEPKAKGIIQCDYLKKRMRFNKDRIIIGNPPFGKRGKLAIEFVNKGLKEGTYVAMILPNIFNRYMAQRQINPGAKLIFSYTLAEDSFLVGDKSYGVKCVFQIWTTKTTFASNKRILQAPQIRHDDSQTWIHNNTKHTQKYFDKEYYGWDIAVHRQGYYNYKQIITDPKELIPNRQYFFIKAKNKKILRLIKKIDFVKLSKTNTQVLGYSTSDFVKEYKKIKENHDSKNI